MKILSKGIVGRNKDSIFSYQAWPTITKDENGVLYVVTSGHRLGHVCPYGKNLMYKSYDNGKTWTSPIIINDTLLDDRDGGIVYLGNGKFVVTFFNHPASVYENEESKGYFERFIPKNCQKMAFSVVEQYKDLTEEQRKGGSFVILSNDYGNTWSKPIKVPISAPHGPALAKDGTLMYLGSEMYNDCGLEKDSVWFYKSFDGGLSWQQISKIPHPEWLNENEFFCEPHVIELDDGTILGAFRIEGRFEIATATSNDGGKTWQNIKLSGLKGSPPHLYRHSSGAILCSYGKRVDACAEMVAVSYDNGNTWKRDVCLSTSNNTDIGYPSTVELENGELITAYYQRFEDDEFASILYTKWKL